METYRQKIIRHLRQGPDIQSVVRGGVELFERAKSLGIDWESYDGPDISRMFGGHLGLDLYTYSFNVKVSFSSIQYKPTVILFPPNSSLCVEVTDNPQSPAHYLSSRGPQTIAAFTGPTFTEESHFLPNNGFYHEHKYINPFEETSPHGQRRGAVVVDRAGSVSIINDHEKWDMLNGNMEEVHSMSGTSWFFTSDDKLDDQEFSSFTACNDVSYLIWHQDKKGNERLAFTASRMPVQRGHMKLLVDAFARDVDASYYRATELEYTGSSCVVKS